MADNTFPMVQNTFPDYARVSEEGVEEIKMLTLKGAHYEWKRYESGLRERVYFGLTAAGKHLSNQNYDNVYTEYRFDKENTKSGSYNAVDVVITDLDDKKVVAMIENGMFESTCGSSAITKANLDKALYIKLSQVVSVPLKSQYAMDKMGDKVAFNVNIYHETISLENTKQHHQYVNLDKTMSYFERFQRTGIASVMFVLTKEDLVELQYKHPNGMNEKTGDDARDYKLFDLNTPYSNVALMFLNGGNATGHSDTIPSETSFKYIFSQNLVDPLVLNRILPRSLNAGGSAADNPRAKNRERIKADRAPFIKSQLEYLRRINFKYQPELGTQMTMEAATISSGNRVVQASSEQSIVLFKDIVETIQGKTAIVEKQVLVIAPDMTLNDAQHSNDTILMNKRAMIEANGDAIKIKKYVQDELGIDCSNLSPSQAQILAKFILKLTPSVVFEAYLNLDTMTQAGDIKQNVKEQGLQDKAKFIKKPQLKTMASAVSKDPRLADVEITTGAPFSDAHEHTIDSGLPVKEMADVSSYTSYLDIKDFNKIIKSANFKKDVAELEQRRAAGEISYTVDSGKIMTAIHLVRKGIATARAVGDLTNFYNAFTTSPIGARIKDKSLDTLHEMQKEDLNAKEQSKIWDTFYKSVKTDYKNTFKTLDTTFNALLSVDIKVPNEVLVVKAQEISDLKVEVDTDRLVPLTIMSIASDRKRNTLVIKDDSTLPMVAVATVIGYRDYINGTNILEKSAEEIFKAVDDTFDELIAKSEEKIWIRLKPSTIENGHINRFINYFGGIIDFNTPTVVKANPVSKKDTVTA